MFLRSSSFVLRPALAGVLLLRLFLGLRIFYGVVDNVLYREKMMEFAGFLQDNRFPFPALCAITSVWVQFFCSIFILLGFKQKWASFFLMVNFSVALLFVHIPAGDSIEAMTPALAMLFISTALFIFSHEHSADHIFH